MYFRDALYEASHQLSRDPYNLFCQTSQGGRIIFRQYFFDTLVYYFTGAILHTLSLSVPELLSGKHVRLMTWWL